MSIKLTAKQYELLLNAVQNRIKELNDLLNPILIELEEHNNFLSEYSKIKLTPPEVFYKNHTFETLSWSKKIIQVFEEKGKAMTANEIVAAIVNHIPGLAEESSTRSSVASLLSRRTGKLFKKINGRFGLIEWTAKKFN